MSPLRSLSAVALAALACPCFAAAPKEVDAAVQKGAAYLKQQYGGAKPLKAEDGDEGTGAAALAGLALLEAGTPADDAGVTGIAAAVRDASFGEARTYHVALGLMFLDRLGDPADVPLVQMLGVRLLAGQNAAGGWSYDCVASVSQADMTALRAALMNAELRAGARPPAEPKPAAPARPAAPAGRLHAEVEKYAGRLATSRDRTRDRGDDNSNTQFGILGTWVARRHGVPTDAALALIEKRFLATQTGTGGWPYSGPIQGSPSMTCAGLLGLATAVGLREERRLRAEGPRTPDPAPKANPAPPAEKTDDPFFNPPPVPKSADPFFDPPAAPGPKAKAAPVPKAPAKLPADARDAAVERGLAALGRALAGEEPAGKGGKNRVLAGRGLGNRDFYFLWSLERVGVVFGLEKIGGTDWYQLGADELVAAQRANGSWGKGAGGGVVDTSFAVLFLSRSNLVRDLTARVANDPANAELRAARLPDPHPGPAAAPEPKTPAAVVPPPTVALPAPVPLPPPTPAAAPVPVADSRAVAADLVGTPDADWDAALVRVRDGKGAAYTQALVAAVAKLDGDRRRAAREALAERLTRMSAETLRAMAGAGEPELRRAAVLAMAMKDDAAHLPDLVAALADADAAVARAARAGLKAVTGEDFGPEADATPAERAAAIRAWAAWVRKQK
ncbi:hypothetical protein [Gemmata sp.]|uniref:hypothetical protein n=1 Tax=Gemmata sp. TaxID=1914242 RepID=UPI003F71B62A